MMKDYASVTQNQIRFTEIIKEIEKLLDGYFPTWEVFPGLKTDELKEYLCQYAELYEDEKGELHSFYSVDGDMVKMFTRWLGNYDFVAVKHDRCLVEYSNNREVAEKLNQLAELAR